MAFLRPSPLPTHVQMGSPTQVPGSKGTSTGPAAGKTQGQRRFLWPAQSFSPGLRLSAGQSPDPRPLPGADQVTQDVCVQSPSGKRELPARFSLCPSEARGLEPPPSTASPPPAFQGSRCSREGSRWPRWGGAFCFRSAGRVPKAGRGMESGSCLVIEASPRLCRGDEAGAPHGGRTWQQREGLRGGTWRDGNHHRGQAWPTVQVSNAMLGQGDFSSGHWGATVVRELRRCTPGPGAGL